jgi:hypothetical protein
MARKKSQVSGVYRLHRSLGAGASVFVMFMVLSGLAINHSNQLGLDQQQVTQSYVLDWYGLGRPESLLSLKVGGEWISFAGSQLYLNDRSVSTLSNGIGAVSNDEMLIVAGSDELLLLGRDGGLIERQPWGPPGAMPIGSIGLLDDGSVVVKCAGQYWLADAELLNWQHVESIIANVEWSTPETTPEALRRSITQQYRGGGLNLERVLLDLHSGRIFGSVGLFVYDLLALAIGILAISGLLFWFRGRRNGNGNRKKRSSTVINP